MTREGERMLEGLWDAAETPFDQLELINGHWGGATNTRGMKELKQTWEEF